MTKIPSDDILEGLYKLRIRESEKLKTVLELYNIEIHQKTAGPDYHRLKTMVKRSIEQNLRNKNFEAANENFERNAVVKNQGTKQREQRTPGDCWQWETNGQCSEGDNCSFRHDINKRAKLTQPNPSPSSFMQQNERNASRTRSPRGKSPSGTMSRWSCKDYFKGTCTTPFCEKFILQYACSTSRRMDADWGKSALICTDRLMNSPAQGPKRMVTKVQWLCWRSMSSIIERGDPLYTPTHQIHDNWVVYSRIWSRRSLHRFYGRAQTYGNRSHVENSRMPLYVTLTPKSFARNDLPRWTLSA